MRSGNRHAYRHEIQSPDYKYMLSVLFRFLLSSEEKMQQLQNICYGYLFNVWPYDYILSLNHHKPSHGVAQ